MDEDAQEIRQALQGIQLFSDVLSAEQLDRFAERCTLQFFPAGSALIRQGDVASSMFGILQGTVLVTIVDAGNRRTDLRRLPAGTVVGELEILSGEPRTATITAVTEVQAVAITKPVLEEFLARSPELVQSFVAIGAIRREMLDQVLGKPRGALWARFASRLRRLLFPA